MIEKILYKQKLYAIIIRNKFSKDTRKFFPSINKRFLNIKK